MNGELHLPGLSDESIRELMEFGSKVQSLARTELSALARSLYHRERMPIEAAEAISQAAGALIEGKLSASSSEWFQAEMRSVRRRQLRYRGGAIQRIEERGKHSF